MLTLWSVIISVVIISVTAFVRFQVLTAASMKFRFVYWDVLPCKIIVDRRFRGTCCLHHQGDESVHNCFTRQYIPEDKSELITAFVYIKLICIIASTKNEKFTTHCFLSSAVYLQVNTFLLLSSANKQQFMKLLPVNYAPHVCFTSDGGGRDRPQKKNMLLQASHLKSTSVSLCACVLLVQ
jgi:hypothetical protein